MQVNCEFINVTQYRYKSKYLFLLIQFASQSLWLTRLHFRKYAYEQLHLADTLNKVIG